MASIAAVSRNALMWGALAALVVQGPPVAFAQGERAGLKAFNPNSRVIDGEPTVEACARYGYRAGDGYEDRAGQGNIGITGRRIPQPTVAPPAIMASPPPPPPPPMMMRKERASPQYALAPPSAPAPMLPGPPPGTIETERYPDAPINTVRRVAEAPVSTFSIDVDTASYSNVRRFLADGSLPPRDSVRVEEMVNYFDYAYPHPRSAETPFQPFVAVAPSPWAGGKEIVHIGLQGYDLDRREQPPLNLVFLVDVSGSMSSPDKLDLAVQSLNVLIDKLRPPEATRFALAVAGFGQRLRGDPWMKAGFGWGDIAKVADRSRSYDPDGLRSQFVTLVNRAGEARSVND